MRRYRIWLLAVVLSLSIPMLSAPASAWEFTMTGFLTWEYDYRTQMGTAGFFGQYNRDNGAAGTAIGRFAPLNAWLGIQAFDLVSGSDAAWNVMYMINNMELRINPAVRVRGSYWIGEWNPHDRFAAVTAATVTNSGFFGTTDRGVGDLVASEYLNNRYPGVQRSFSPGYWNLLWLTAQLPWGELSLGKRPSTFGLGLFYNGVENRTSESCSLIATYGPLRIGLSFYPARRASGTAYFNNDYDKNNGRLFDLGLPTITYRQGPLDMGITANYGQSNHLGGEGALVAPATRNSTRRAQDFIEWYSVAYGKYNNGRFFFNAEVAWYTATTRFRLSDATGMNPIVNNLRALDANGNNTPGTRDEYVETWRWMVEAGVLCGPAKVAALYAWLDGADRRQGIQIDRTGLATLPTTVTTNAETRYRASSAVRSNTGVFRPYSLLMVYSYGLGTHINADTGNGYAEDAAIYAARVDYAVAANLNLFGSFMWADRASKSGFGWGFIRPAIDGQSAVVLNLNSRNFAPSIPDTNLGWEADWGFDWKLLEGLLVNATFAYWRPGKWWNFACVDKRIPDWNVGTPTNNWGTDPSRSIDPIWGVELKVVSEF